MPSTSQDGNRKGLMSFTWHISHILASIRTKAVFCSPIYHKIDKGCMTIPAGECQEMDRVTADSRGLVTTVPKAGIEKSASGRREPLSSHVKRTAKRKPIGPRWHLYTSIAVALMLISVGALALMPTRTGAQGEWVVSLIDPSDSPMTVYGSTSMALDSSGSLHVGYRIFSDVGPWYPYLLKYASRANESWTIADVDSEGNAVTAIPTSLAVNSSGVVHIGYANCTDGVGTFKLATNASTGWSLTNVSTFAGMGGTMCLDLQDRIHCSFMVQIGDVRALAYSNNDGGSWSTEIVDDRVDCWMPEIKADSNGKIHILYTMYESNWSMHYATNSGGSWTTQQIDGLARYGSLALDSNDVPHVAYAKDVPGGSELRLAWLSGGQWFNTTVDTASSIADRPCIFVDTVGENHIGYVIENYTTLMYAHSSGLTWVKSVVEHFESDLIPVLASTSLVVDSMGHAHIVYIRSLMSGYDAGGGLKYATNSSYPIPEISGSGLLICVTAMAALVILFGNRRQCGRR